MADSAIDAIQGYVCTPHDKQSASLIEHWKKDDNLVDLYFVTATFSAESTPYFPNKAYLLASFRNMEKILDDIKRNNMDRLSFMFSYSSPLFERTGERLNYVSLYFTKYTNGDMEIGDLANTIARRDRVTKASLARMEIVASEQTRYIYQYSKKRDLPE